MITEQTWRGTVAALLKHINKETCTHEETRREGAIWETCSMCGATWADDKGGKPEFKWPRAVEAARALMAEPEVRMPPPTPIVVTEAMHRAAVKVLLRAPGLDGLPERMLRAMQVALTPQTSDTPALYTAFTHTGKRPDIRITAIPRYSHETADGVRSKILAVAHSEGFKGTLDARLKELGWWVAPVFAKEKS